MKARFRLPKIQPTATQRTAATHVEGETVRISKFGLILLAMATVANARDNKHPYVVVIDPGHGGHDPGAISPVGGGAEKSVTLSIARAVRDRLGNKRGLRIILTRSNDRFVTLVGRRAVAEASHADLFLSIHADSAPDPSARGASIYTLREDGRPVVVRRIAATSSYDGVSGKSLDPDVASILGDLKQRDAMNDSAGFAISLAADLAPVIAMRSQPRLSAHFAVLKAEGIPAVLLETGYVTNREDVDVLFSDHGQKRVAKAIAKAIEQTADAAG